MSRPLCLSPRSIGDSERLEKTIPRQTELRFVLEVGSLCASFRRSSALVAGIPQQWMPWFTGPHKAALVFIVSAV
jgi:hypothetical protein